ncbi:MULTISPECIES: enoyl-CoA hydratase [unclassified Thalassospira]|uniref:enoyl-CoA hydratase n=1 Tax=unclassified Thalassospira TaxID=2648997 RepID=UPI001B27E5AB|nr:enoyl-CoA hydratase [Thalassospira sp.]MBO6772324.1 enoyl-CoA hydratase [Thalassospira sp.]
MTTATPSSPLVTRHDHDGYVTLVLSNPARRNALSAAMMSALQDAFDDIAQNPDIRCVILAADGPVFCAGHDLKEMGGITDCDQHASLFAQCSRLMMRIVTLPQPVIARVRGMATAAGCQLVASCDLAVAARSAKFATPGVNIGLFCSTPMVALSRNIARKHAMRMLLTGDPVPTDTAFAMGLVSDVVDDDDLETATDDLAAGIAARSGMTVRLGKQAFYKQIEMPLPDAYAYASDVMTANMQKHDAREGIGAFVEKRHPTWRHE